MCRIKSILKKIVHGEQKRSLESYELVCLLDDQIGNGDQKAVNVTLKRLGRQLFPKERLDLINSCILNKRFWDAFFLSQGLPSNIEKKILLEKIVRDAAFADDISTARCAALYLEQMEKGS